MARAYPDSSECKIGPTLGRMSFHCRATHTRPHWRVGQCRHTSSPNVHSFGIWEETRVPGENSCRHEKKVHTPQRQWPRWESIFFVQLYHKTLFEDLMLLRIADPCVLSRPPTLQTFLMFEQHCFNRQPPCRQTVSGEVACPERRFSLVGSAVPVLSVELCIWWRQQQQQQQVKDTENEFGAGR